MWQVYSVARTVYAIAYVPSDLPTCRSRSILILKIYFKTIGLTPFTTTRDLLATLVAAVVLFVPLQQMALAQDSHANYVPGSLRATPVAGTTRILVEWEVADPGIVLSFDLRRRTGDKSAYRSVPQECIRRSGNSYWCEDAELFKEPADEAASANTVIYELWAEHEDGSHYYDRTNEMEYTTNAARRTWGSIKLMFQ